MICPAINNDGTHQPFPVELAPKNAPITLEQHANANGWTLEKWRKVKTQEPCMMWENTGGTRQQVFKTLEKLCDEVIGWPLYGDGMRYGEAYARLQCHRARQSSTYGTPRDAGYNAIYHLPDGRRVNLSNGAWHESGFVWKIEHVGQ